MAISNVEFRDEFQAWFVPLWNATTFNAVLAFDNMPGDPPQGATLWGRVHIKETDGGRASLGTNAKFRHSGTIFIQIFVPVGTGTAAIGSVAQSLAEAIQDTGQIGNVWFRDTATKEVGISDEVWYQFNVETDFQYDRNT